jgi:hypothetical protein
LFVAASVRGRLVGGDEGVVDTMDDGCFMTVKERGCNGWLMLMVRVSPH